VKILHVTYADGGGGAARAAYRLHAAQRAHGVDSVMWVMKKATGDPHVHQVSEWFPGRNAIAQRIEQRILRAMPAAEARSDRSLNIVPSRLHRRINGSDADVVHLHWIHLEMISVSEIARITKPLVWTLHDGWAGAGTEHYPAGTPPAWIDRLAAARKRRQWQDRSFVIVSPSQWLSDRCAESAVLRGRPARVVPNPVLPGEFSRQERARARRDLGLGDDRIVLLFGAHDVSLPRKGADLLSDALTALPPVVRRDVALVVFGGGELPAPMPVPVRRLGWIGSDLATWYNAADAHLVPSRIDNLPNTVGEAMCCGLPSVGFRIGGLPDLIDHRRTGYLAEPFDVNDFAAGIHWVLGASREALQRAIVERSRMLRAEAVVPAYLDIYAHAVAAT
jgi:glycosyltransferase involved in cell wall biosynthesis